MDIVYTPLHRFAWGVKRGVFPPPPPALQAIPARATLSIWVDKSKILVGGERCSLGAFSADEDMLDWLVLSVESSWTQRRVLLWLFPDFSSILFDIITSETNMV
jgi:hypothetical protein